MKAKLLTISLMVGLFMGCHDFLDVKACRKIDSYGSRRV